jgi:predicted nucleotidyltransferase
LRILFSRDLRYQPFIAAAVPAKVLGCDAMVASLPDLVTGKVLAWSDPQRRLSKRKKDEADLIRLAEDHPEVRPLLPEELRRQLAGG